MTNHTSESPSAAENRNAHVRCEARHLTHAGCANVDVRRRAAKSQGVPWQSTEDPLFPETTALVGTTVEHSHTAACFSNVVRYQFVHWRQ
jgi:hypothetical protein